MTDRIQHGVDEMLWDNLGDGWRIFCLCGWTSGAWSDAAGVGGEFDQHLRSAEEPQR